MTTYRRICLHDHVIEDGDKRLELKRGKEYTTSRTEKGKCMVFTAYWAWVPAKWFGGVIKDEPSPLAKALSHR